MDNLIIGRKPIQDAIDDHQEFEKIWILRGLTGDIEKAIRKYCQTNRVALSVVPHHKLSKLTDGNHQGVVGLLSRITYTTFADWTSGLLNDQSSSALIIDGVSDVRNFGAICRSAAVFGVHYILYSFDQSAPINDVSIKASAGAILKLNICRVKSLVRSIEELQMNDFFIIASCLDGEPISDDSLPSDQRSILVLGSEEKGVSKKILQISDQKITIPQVGEVDSLNVSVAAGILLYEMRKHIETSECPE